MKKVGIACDNYKVKTFRKTLKKAGISINEVVKFTMTTSLIIILTVEEKIPEIGKICNKLQIDFTRSN